MKWETYHNMKRHPIAADYAAGRESALARFDSPSPYLSVSAWKERAEWLSGAERLSAGREAVAEAVIQYNRRHNDVPEAVRNAELLRHPEALVVVGGQQAGLFTGPMLVIYKAITVLRTAQAAAAALGRPVVPVFWIAGEDHDWDEVNHTYIVTQQQEVQKLSIAHPHPDRRTSVSRTEVSGAAWEEPLRMMADALPNTEFKPGIMDELGAVAAQSANLSEAFAKTLSLLFGKHGLVLMDSDDPGLRTVETPMFGELLKKQKVLSDALKQGEREVAGRGYPLQAESSGDCCNLFLFHEGERKLLYRSGEGDEIVDRKGTLRIPLNDLMCLLETDPAAFSNNALTRPLMQEFLFPTLAAVLGPSEIAYWSTLQESFRLFGQRMPVIVPRQEFTLLEGTVQKQMEKFAISFDDAWLRWEPLRDQWLAAQDALGVAAQFDQAKAAFAELYQPLVNLSASINPGLRKLGETNMSKILEQIEFLKTKSADAVKQQHEAGLRQWDRIRITVAPAGKPQERVVNVFQYIARYGFPWLDALIEQTPLDFAAGYKPHEIVYL